MENSVLTVSKLQIRKINTTRSTLFILKIREFIPDNGRSDSENKRSHFDFVLFINIPQEDNFVLDNICSGSSAAPSKAMKATLLSLLLTHQFSCQSFIGKWPSHREDAIVINTSIP